MSERRTMTQAETQKFLDDLLENGIKPHQQTLAEIALRGEVAVIAYKPDPMAFDALDALGWKKRPAFAVTRTRMREIAEQTPQDKAFQAWAARPSGEKCLRIFVFQQSGTFLVNCRQGGDLEIEPGSTDSEWMT